MSIPRTFSENRGMVHIPGINQTPTLYLILKRTGRVATQTLCVL